MRATTPSHRWLVVPQQINKATGIAFARVFIGVFWLFEVTVGHNWKLGGFGSGTNPGWIGPNAGDSVREEIATAVDDGTWSWIASLYQNVIEPNATLFAYLVIGLQVAFGVLFIIGLLVRPTALVALTMDLSILFLGNSRIPPFFFVAHLFLLATGAGMYFGADGWITQRLADAKGAAARRLRQLIDLPLMKIRGLHPALLGAAVITSAYFFMQIAMRPTPRMNMVAMELAVLFGLLAAGLHYARWATDRIGVLAALLRVFIGFKFLHEIWVRTEPGVNSLPGWAGVEKQRAVFETVSDHHWAPMTWITDAVVLPAMPLWAVVFGVVQFTVGVALVLGFRTRAAAMVGLTYLAGLSLLGLTRYAPFAFGLLVVVLALDGGRLLSFDSRRALQHPPRYGLPIPRGAVPVLTAVFALNAVAATIAVFASGGIAPDGYTESMGQVTTAMVAIFSGMFAVFGTLQLRSGGPEPIEAGEGAHDIKEWVEETAAP